MADYSYLNNASGAVIDDLYKQYQLDSTSIDFGWQKFFEGYELAIESGAACPLPPATIPQEAGVLNLIAAYRQHGHLYSKTNPVRPRRTHREPIRIEDFGLASSDLQKVFHAGGQLGLQNGTLQQIIDYLEETYCASIGVEYVYMRPSEAQEWLQHRMESCRNNPPFSKEEKLYILNKLNQAVVFENFLHTKFVGQKRFSLEGAESVIPALDAIIERGADLGIEEFVVGMAHRGRLNVLVNVLGKSYEDIFTEFEGKAFNTSVFEGDVKYHLGYSCDRVTQNGQKVHLSLTPNPSHLEAVNPVVEGIVRAKIDARYGGDLKKIAPILIHGDASIAGQGIIYEVLQMSTLPGYRTGGTIHVVLNNQVGFTTNYLDGRSSTYCTDIAKTTLSPVFHVNGDDAEAVTYVIQLALEYRQQFHRDVFVDIVCYRRYGHNEGDEPRFTQPVLYDLITKHPNPRDVYQKKLTDRGDFPITESQRLDAEFRTILEKSLDQSKLRQAVEVGSHLKGEWQGIRLATSEDFINSPETGVDSAALHQICQRLNDDPVDLNFFKKIRKLFEDRRKMIDEINAIDWGMGELLAYGSLLEEGIPVRLSGQDVERGTFSHRHAVVKLEDSEEHYIPLHHLSPEQAPFYVYNSLLSEYGVLGFEFGYNMARPGALTIWEAQFGDFANGAQIIIDQFLSASETKWQRMSGLVLLLPHGYEGQGPEHSSGRMERFLTLCADYNMQVVNCTTPANFFHVLRRQVKRDIRKPLIVFTPKSLLRHPRCVSRIEDFATGTCFQELIDDVQADPKQVKRLLVCTGKIYYELRDRQQTEKRQDIALIRLEQIYPFPEQQFELIQKKYTGAVLVWIQEEPENMGAWAFILRKFWPQSIQVISRRSSGTTATGFLSVHQREQKQLIDHAFLIP